MKLLLALLTITLSLAVNAEATKMAIITSEFDNDVREYFLETDSKNHIHSMRYITYAPNGSIVEDSSVTPEQVSDTGIVLYEHRGYKAVILELEKFNNATGGIIKINYLYSGVTGQRNVKRFQLKLVNGKFLLFDGDKRVNKMFFAVNSNRVLGVIGVKEIKTSFDPSFK